MASVSPDKAAMVASPKPPSGHGRDAPGSPAISRAVPATAPQKVPATAIRAVAAHGARTVSGTAAVPRRVTGATSGAASTFAGRA